MSRRLTPCTIIPPELYVIREADKQLRNVLKDMGRPGYILVARQMGKTNLLLNAKRELEDHDNAFIYVDLSAPFSSERECFRHIIDTALETRADIFRDCKQQIVGARQASPVPPYKEHENELRTLLNAISGKVVIILDEIDSLTKGVFSDKVFAQIRSVYFTRMNYPQFNRLTYVLSGVVEPNEIIKDKRISPFNIGEKIYLDDFNSEQFFDFLSRAGLVLHKEVADRIYYWANGNPRLTWDICLDIEDKIGSGHFVTPDEVDISVKKLYLSDFTKAPVDHIREVVSADDELRSAITVIKYGKGHTLPDSTKNKLYLTGIIRSVASQKAVTIKNKIIEAALSEQWLLDISVKRKGLAKLADEKYQENNYEEALALYEQLIQSAETSDKERDDAYWDMGRCAYNVGEYQKALAFLEKAHWDKAAAAVLYYERIFYIGACQLQVGNVAASRVSFTEALQTPRKDNTYFSALINLGQTYYAEKNFGEAIKFYQQVFDTAGSSPLSGDESNKLKSLALYSMARAHGSTGDKVKLHKYFQDALAVSSSDQKPAILLAIIHNSTSEQKALLLEKCVELIISNNLHPSSSRQEGTLALTATVFYNLLKESYLANRSAFERLLTFAASLDEFKASNTALFLRLAYLTAGTRDLTSAIKMARDIVETPLPGLAATEDTQFQTFRLLCALCKGKERERYGFKYLEYLKAGYDPKTFDSLDLEILVDIAVAQIRTRKPQDAIKSLGFAKKNKALLPSEQTADFATIHLYEMVAYRESNARPKLRQAAQETLTFLESLAGRLGQARMVSAESLKTIESFARDNLAEPREVVEAIPIIAPRKHGRNERVSVRYPNGTIKTEVKFKTVEADIREGRCILVN